MPRNETILQGGRAKAYRPMPAAARRSALEAGLAAYADDDFFEAHELLEPAWMGTRDLAERELIQGLIKLAAAYVHQARGNPRGVEKNLRGARPRIAAGAPSGPRLGIDTEQLLAGIDARLARRSAADDRAPAIGRLPVTATRRRAPRQTP